MTQPPTPADHPWLRKDQPAGPEPVEGEVVDDEHAQQFGGGSYRPGTLPAAHGPASHTFDAGALTPESLLGAVQSSPVVRRAAGVPLVVLVVFVLGPSIGNLLLSLALKPIPKAVLLIAGGIGVLYCGWLLLERRLLNRETATVIPRRLGWLIGGGIALAIGLSLLFMLGGFLALIQAW